MWSFTKKTHPLKHKYSILLMTTRTCLEAGSNNVKYVLLLNQSRSFFPHQIMTHDLLSSRLQESHFFTKLTSVTSFRKRNGLEIQDEPSELYLFIWRCYYENICKQTTSSFITMDIISPVIKILTLSLYWWFIHHITINVLDVTMTCLDPYFNIQK